MSESSYRYGLSAKFTLDQHTAIIEYANQHTNGNYSNALRRLVVLGLDANKDKKLSAGEKLAIADMKRNQKRRNLTRLQQGYISLQQDYDKEYEEALKQFAEDNDLGTWPPDVSQLTIVDVDKILNRTLHAVKQSCDDNGHTSLRDIYRRTNDTKEFTLRQLEELRRLGYVDFEDPAFNNSCQVTLLKS